MYEFMFIKHEFMFIFLFRIKCDITGNTHMPILTNGQFFISIMKFTQRKKTSI